MIKFIGRQAQLEYLDRAYRSDRSEFIPVLGRRRVGKSHLLLHFLRENVGKRAAVYFCAREVSATLNVEEFARIAAQVLAEQLLRKITRWDDLFAEITRRSKAGRKLVLVMDEFQWAARASPELPSLLQGLWDRQWQHSGQVMLILCGSEVGFMEKEVLGRQSPLFGRRTGQIELKPFDPIEAAAFHEPCSLEERAKIYFLTGGIPYYLREFDAGLSPEQNIRKCFLHESSVLANEPPYLLREELKEVPHFYTILLALGTGKTRLKEIAEYAGNDPRNLEYYLKQLAQLNYVAKKYPTTGKEPAARLVRYEIADPLLRFWFRFIFPHQSQIPLLGPDLAFQTLIQPELPAYWGECFERFCRQALWRIYLRREGVMGRGLEIGEYWDKQVQIDVVGIRPDQRIDLGECRWGAVRSLPSLLGELQAKAQWYPNPHQLSIGLRLFLRKAPSAKLPLPGVKIHALEDLYQS